jgi:hypothetical protein
MTLESRIPPFRAADPDKFRQQAPQFAEFLTFASGRLWALINSEPSYIQMAVYTHNGMPALAALTHALDPFIAPLDDEGEHNGAAKVQASNLRKAIGSMVRAVMEANGFGKTGEKRGVPPEPRRIFKSGEVFRQAPPAGTPPEFDWDCFLGQASFADVRRLSPELDGRRPPSLYSPDKKLYYSSSLDTDVECANEQDLRSTYKSLMESWRHHAHEPLRRPLKLHTLRVDITEVVGLLGKIVDDPNEFEDIEVRLLKAAE